MRAGAEDYELLVDADRGVLLRSAARLRGEEFEVIEVEEISFDEDIPEDLFSEIDGSPAPVDDALDEDVGPETPTRPSQPPPG